MDYKTRIGRAHSIHLRIFLLCGCNWAKVLVGRTIERWGFHDDMIGMVEMSSYFSSDFCWFCFFFRWIFDFSLYAICQISAAQMCHWIHGFYGVQKKEAQHLLLLNWERERERAHGLTSKWQEASLFDKLGS